MAVPTSAFSITLSVRMENSPGVLGRMATEIGNIGGNIIGVNGFEAHGPTVTNEIIVYCRDEAHARKVVELTKGISGVQLIEAYDRTFKMHEGGKIEVISLAPVR
ncbi:MAG: NAD-dependent malic enzyme, partial [Acidimicrobiales bacterium]